MKQYLDILIDSLVKKEDILTKLIDLNEKQKQLIDADVFDGDAFDDVSEQKGEWIDKLDSLDDGFETVFERVSDGLSTEDGKKQYRNEIIRMQDLIQSITDKSMQIQRGEESNKQALERYFHNQRDQIKSGRVGTKAALNYYRNMKNTNVSLPHFLDSKN